MAVESGQIFREGDEVDAFDGLFEDEVIGDAGVEDGDFHAEAPEGVFALDAEIFQEVAAEGDGTVLRAGGLEGWDGRWEIEARFLCAIEQGGEVSLVSEADEEGIERGDAAEDGDAGTSF